MKQYLVQLKGSEGTYGEIAMLSEDGESESQMMVRAAALVAQDILDGEFTVTTLDDPEMKARITFTEAQDWWA